MMTSTTTAVCDRIVDGETAVLLLEGAEEANEGHEAEPKRTADATSDPAETQVGTQLTVDVTVLPSDGRHEGAVFEVTYDDERLLEATYQPETTLERRDTIQNKFDRLSERLDE